MSHLDELKIVEDAWKARVAKLEADLSGAKDVILQVQSEYDRLRAALKVIRRIRKAAMGAEGERR